MSDEKTASQKAYDKAKENDNLGDRGDWIKFKGTGEHILTFVNDKAYEGENFKTGEDEYKVRYEFEEDGEKKLYDAPYRKRDPETHEKTKELGNFVQQMAQFDYGDKVKAYYQQIEGTPRGFIKVEPVDEDSDDIPVVEEDEEVPSNEDIEEEAETPSDEDIDVDDIPF